MNSSLVSRRKNPTKCALRCIDPSAIKALLRAY
jgi:hypothetical protein